MRIAEIFRSVQGEGLLTGMESVFVRASGCNLRCRYCDTPYASWAPEGDDLSVEEIAVEVDRVARSGDSPAANIAELEPVDEVRHVVVTGGEPMLFAELIPLCAALRRGGRHLTIETAGTLYLPLACDLMSISPKLSNATPSADEHPGWPQRHERTRHAPEVIRKLIAEHDYQLKFVVYSPEDCREVEAYLTEFPQVRRDRAMLMPQGTDPKVLAEKAAWLKPYCDEHALQFCPRRQIEWFGSVRGT
jgi:7-carboxy-7-deazaguanine synthase